MSVTTGQPPEADSLWPRIERAMLLADQLEGVERRWAFFWLGGVSKGKDEASLRLLDLVLEGRLTFAEARTADGLQATGGTREA